MEENRLESTGRTSIKLPPGPSDRIPVNELRKNSLKYLFNYTDTFGDIVRYQADEWLVILVNRPDYIKYVLQDNYHNYTKAGTPDLLMLRPMLGEGLMTSEGETWMQQRRLIQPAFHRERIETFGTLITTATSAMLDKWQQFAAQGEPVEIVDEMAHLTLQIVAQSLFSADLSQEADNFGQAIGVMNQYMAHFDPYDLNRLRQFRSAMETLNKLVYKIIQKRRNQSQDADDLLALLMSAQDEQTGEQMNNRQLQDQVFTLLMAGHETTAKALTWTLYLLDQHPYIFEQLGQELASVLGGRLPTCRDLPSLTYTWMVIQESMRLYPPVWSMSRLCCQDDEIGGYHIPSGALVLISPYAMHRHPEFWTNPEQFNPDRFHPSVSQERPNYTYLPFSGGLRQCIGRSLATVETQLVLATIVQRFRLHLVADHPVEPEALVTLRPKFGLPMTIHPYRL